MSVLVTGAAGFIGYSVASALLARGETVIGVDNMNAYYEVGLKRARLARLRGDFSFHEIDIADDAAVRALPGDGITGIVHLAAQAGVRHSLTDPYTYVTSNVMGQVVMLEFARRLPRLAHFVYASSSSVYGGRAELPYAVTQAAAEPSSLYAATKRADELITHAYAHLYGLAATGLRFFTVYGPWGRPDMAAFKFTKSILAGAPISVFNHGEMWRDFTYIDDIVAGILSALERPPVGTPPHAIYNLGSDRPEKLMDMIAILEQALGKTAIMAFEPMQPGDIERTHADIEVSRRELGFEPSTPLRVGLPKFVAWYRSYYGAPGLQHQNAP
jgi:UDP-glucuronate 4-epimerase